jgi:hypothetical protein
MGAGAIKLAADEELRAGIRAAGWRLGDDEIEPVDESDPEIARVIRLLRRLAARVKRATNAYAAAGGPSLDRLLECLRLACARLPIAGAAITAYDPLFDGDGRTLAAARRVAAEVANGIRLQPASDTS